MHKVSNSLEIFKQSKSIMGQKIHPLSLRIQSSTRYFDSAWYSDHFFSKLISVDIAILNYLNTFYKIMKLPKARFSIYHLPKTTKLYSFFCYPKQSRDFKSKVFNIPSGLFDSKTKKYKNTNALVNSIFSEGVSPRKTSKQNSLSLVNYNLFKTDSKQQNEYQHSIKNSWEDTKNISALIEKPILFDRQFSHFLIDSYKNKNSTIQNPQEVLRILKECLLFSKIPKLPYMIPKKTFEFSPQVYKTTDAPVKYNTKLEKNLSHFLNSNIISMPFQASSELQDAGYFADELVFLLERRISFRQIKNKLLKQFSLNPYIQGVRITCSGRVGGKSKKAQRARLDSIKYGQTSLHIFSSQIDFAVRTASTPLGSTGVKVWICYK